ncbi:MAG: ABC transporter substrate-binding protein [Alphaproteobacteria bacterium]
MNATLLRTALLFAATALTTIPLAKIDAADKEPYTLGVSEPLSGAASSLGVPVVESIELAADAINKKGGVDGHPIKLLIRDDQSKPDVAVTNFRNLIDAGVYGIIGPNLGSNTLAVAPIVKKAEVPLCAFNNTISITHLNNPYVFRCQINDEFQVKAALLFAKNKLNASNVGMIYTSDAYGTDAYNAVKGLLKETGVTLVGAEEINYTSTDTTPEWTKLLAANPQAVLLWGSGSTMAVTLRNANQLGNKTPIIAGQGVATLGIIEAAGPAAEGIYLLGLTAPDKVTPGQQELSGLLKEKHGADFRLYPYNTIGWDAMHIYAKALELAKGKKSDMLHAMESVHDLVLASGTYNFSPSNHDGLGLDAVWIDQVRGGKMYGFQHGM